MYQQAVLQQLNKQLTDQMSTVEQTSLAVSINSPLVNYVTMKGDYYARKKARDELNRDYLAPMLNSSRSMFSFQVYMNDPLQIDPNANIQYLPLASASGELVSGRRQIRFSLDRPARGRFAARKAAGDQLCP